MLGRDDSGNGVRAEQKLPFGMEKVFGEAIGEADGEYEC